MIRPRDVALLLVFWFCCWVLGVLVTDFLNKRGKK